jgi:hypothetical protein
MLGPVLRRALSASRKNLPHFDVGHARFFELRPKILVPGLDVELVRMNLCVKENAVQAQAARFGFQSSENLPSQSLASMRLEDRHSADLSPFSGFRRRGRAELNQATRSNCVPAVDGQHVVGVGVFGVVLDVLGNVLLFDENDLSKRESLAHAGLVGNGLDEDGIPFADNGSHGSLPRGKRATLAHSLRVANLGSSC